MSILIYGSKELGRVTRHLLGECHLSFSGYIDDIHAGPDIIGPFEIIRKDHSPEKHAIINAVGYKNLQVRQEITDKIIGAGYVTPTLVHPTAYVARDAVIGTGCIIMAQAVIDTNVHLGDGVVLWPGAVINHDAVVQKNSFLSPNSTVCGGAVVGSNCFVGAGAVVVEHRRMDDATFLGALEIWK
jgi:sugar O-acyltransferase (sialic acid O-acetyltransferase NeuD family)